MVCIEVALLGELGAIGELWVCRPWWMVVGGSGLSVFVFLTYVQATVCTNSPPMLTSVVY